MAKQFENCSSSYGAPMGRHTVPDLDKSYKSVRLFRVNIDSGGYDDGGAYWGLGSPLWCAQDRDGGRQFIRAATRNAAAFRLRIPAWALRMPLDNWSEYGLAMIDGRCPIPADMDRRDVVEWMRDSGACV